MMNAAPVPGGARVALWLPAEGSLLDRGDDHRTADRAVGVIDAAAKGDRGDRVGVGDVNDRQGVTRTFAAVGFQLEVSLLPPPLLVVTKHSVSRCRGRRYSQLP